MHICSLSKPHRSGRWDLPAGDYLCENLSAFELALDAARETATVMPYHKAPPSAEPMRSVLLVANGGYGDALLLTPALRAFRAKYPESRVALSIRQRIHCIFNGLPYAPELLDYPVPSRIASEFDTVLTFEGIQEDSEEGRSRHAVDIKARILGVGPLEGAARLPEYIVTPEEARWASTTYYRKRGIKRVGVQLQASSPTRTYHPKRCGEVMEKLYAKGYEVYLFGTPGSIPEKTVPLQHRERVKNLTAQDLTFRQSVAVATTCDCLFTPDSSLCHVAGALNIPAVAVFGSTDYRLRTVDYPSVISIQSNVGCRLAPCNHHPKGSLIWPTDGMCSQPGHVGHCTPLNSITPETILDKIEKQLAKS